MTQRGFYVDVSAVPETIVSVYKGRQGKWHLADAVRMIAHLGMSMEDGYLRNEHARQDALLLMVMLNELLTAEVPAALPPPVASARQPRRRHRKLGQNVVDLVAVRRERQDQEIVF